MAYLHRPRPRHDLHARHRVPRGPLGRGRRAGGIPAALSRARLGRARSRRSLAHVGRDHARRARQGGPDGAPTSRRSASPTSARPRSSGTARPASRSTRHRLAGPAHRRDLRAAEGGGRRALVAAKTGLLLDPYFSATKIAWMLDHVPGARARAEAANSPSAPSTAFLIWRLTGGAVHATDATNASRTLLFDIHRGAWDDELCRAVRRAAGDAAGGARQRRRLRRDRACSARPSRSAASPATSRRRPSGRPASRPGMMKSTYGTGCFALLNTGETPVASKNRLLTTIAYQLQGQRTYALEGAIFVAGAAVQWLRDGLGLDRRRRRDRGARGRRRSRPGGLSGAGLRRPRRAALGRGGARRDLRPDPRRRRARSSPAPRWRASATRPAT